MKATNLKRYAMPLWQGIVELIYFSPVWLTIAIYSLPLSLIIPWGLSLLISYMLPRVVAHHRTSIRNVYRIATVLMLGIAPLLLITAVTAVELTLIAWLGCAFVGILVVHSSFRALLMQWTNSFSVILMLILLLSTIALQLLKVIVLHELSDYNTIYYGLGIIAFVLFLYIHNERTIKDQQMIDEGSSTIKRSVMMNRWYISILALLIIGIASAREIQRFIERYAEQLFAAILAWLFTDREAEQQTAEAPAAPMQPIMEMGPEQEPSKFWLLLETIVKWLAISAIVVGVIFLLIYAVKKLLPAIKKLLAHLLKLKSLQSSADKGYTDIIEDIKHERHKEKQQRKHRRPASPVKKWGRLSPAEKVRALYRSVIEHGLRSGKPLAQHLTAKESIALLKQEEAVSSQMYDQLLDRYNDVRYGELEPSEAEVEQLRTQVENASKHKR